MSEEGKEQPGGFSIDLQANAASLNIDKDIYVRILNKAIGQTNGDVECLTEALEQKDFDTVQSISHRLKGDYNNMRITPLASIAKEMNDLVKVEQNVEKLLQLLNDFNIYFKHLEEFMKNHN